MRPSEGAVSVDVEARSYSYVAGSVGAPLTRAIAVEAPIQIVVGGSPFAVMMATPQDLEDFAYGFALSEGIAERVEDIRGVETRAVDDGWQIAIALTSEKLRTHLARKRAISGRTGCGLCGIEDIAEMPSPRRMLGPQPPIEPTAIGAAIDELERRQPLNALTRAVHAAAWCARDGRIVLVREDVGRHNALDKAIGALSRERVAAESGFFVITSRCSFEMVVKAAIFGATTLVSLSAPTSLALERARAFGVAVIAVARADKALSFEAAREKANGGVAA
jgi:FdhD protein